MRVDPSELAQLAKLLAAEILKQRRDTSEATSVSPASGEEEKWQGDESENFGSEKYNRIGESGDLELYRQVSADLERMRRRPSPERRTKPTRKKQQAKG